MTGPFLTAGAAEACPTPCRPRPRDPEAYQAACDAAEGEPVTEHNAVEIAPGMTAWTGHRWLTVTHVIRNIGDTGRVELHFDAGHDTAMRYASLTTPVYILTGAPATHAEQT